MRRARQLLGAVTLALLSLVASSGAVFASKSSTTAAPSQTELVFYVTIRANSTQEEVRAAVELLDPLEITFISEDVARVSFSAGSVEGDLRGKLAGSFGVAQVSGSDPTVTTSISPTQTVPGIDAAGTVVPGFSSTTSTVQSVTSDVSGGGSRALVAGLVGVVTAVSGGVLLVIDQRRRRRLREHPDF